MLVWGLGLLFAVLPVMPTRASDASARRFDIPAAPLAGALETFAEQSGVQLIYPPALADGRRARAVSGRLLPSTALQRLLADSGLEAVLAADDIFVLRARTRSAPRRRAAAPPQDAATRPVVSAPQPMQRVLVTGSRIPRVAMETTTPVSIITRQEIETGGFTTLFDLLRHQPGMAGHHVVDAATETVSNSLTSLVATAVVQSASLYGLGPRGTLYLVDGRRVSSYALPSSSLGGLQDLAAIPLSMVERVEILRGGASAVYGADAVAGVVNIILRREYAGGEVEALYGQSERGDAEIRRVSAGVGFPAASGQLSLVADRLSQVELPGHSRAWHTRDRRSEGLADGTVPLGYYRRFGPLELLPSAPCAAAADMTHQTCRLDRERFRSLRPAGDTHSLRMHWHRALDAEDTTELQVSLRGARTDSRMHAAPMTRWHLPLPPGDARRDVADSVGHAFYDVGPIASRNRATIFDGMVGLRFPVGSWEVNAEISHASHEVDSRVEGLVNDAALQQAIRHGTYRFDGTPNSPATLQALSPPLSTAGRSHVDAVTVRVAGIAGRWRGGQLRAAAGIDGLREGLDYRPDADFGDAYGATPLGMSVRGDTRRFAVFGELEIPFGERLWLEAAGRLDRTQGTFSKFSPRFGAGWRPHDELLVRASVADAFRAPTLYETLAHPTPSEFHGIQVVAPAASAGPCAIEAELADHCLLRIGVATNPLLRPEHAQTRNLGVVWSPHAALDVALDWFHVTRHDEIAGLDAVIDRQLNLDNVVRDAAGRATSIVSRFANVGRSDVRGFNIDADWTLETTASHTWRLRVESHYLTRAGKSGAGHFIEHVGHLAPRVSGAASLHWRSPVWNLVLHLRHFGGYRVHAADAACPPLHVAAGRCRNPSVNLLGAQIGWRVTDDWRVSMQVDNLADRRPVNYDPARTGYNGAIDDPIGRAYVLRAVRTF